MAQASVFSVELDERSSRPALALSSLASERLSGCGSMLVSDG
jgi:hypothetical protein